MVSAKQGGVFSSMEKGRWESKKASKHPLCQRKIEDGLQKGLANLWRGKKITKKAHAGRGQDTKWEMANKRARR
jgi:hypothetical protein